MANKIVKTKIDGIEVEGRVCHRLSRDFEIEITRPFQGLQGGLHIPYFSACKQSFDGKYGDECILQELKNLYGIGSYIADNMESLKEKFRVVDQQINNVSRGKITEEELRTIRLKLRSLLKRGEITIQYQQKVLRWWKSEMEALRIHIELHILDPFFKNNFPMLVPYNTQKQVLDILRNDRKLLGENHGG